MASTEHHVAEEAIELKSPSPGERYPQSINEKNREGSISTEVDTEVSVYFEEGDEVELRESDYTPEQYKKLLRKVDKFLLPLMWCCYGIQQTDKTSLGTQALFGLREDTDLVGQQYQWLTTIFYLSYLCGEFPSNFLLQRWALGRCLSIYMLCWGIVVISIAAAQNWIHLMVLRAMQGFFECTISPGFILVIGTWYKRDEHSSRSLFFQSANAGFGIIADLVMYGIGTHAERYPGSIAAWRCISLFLGASTIVAALTCFVILGSPKEVRWLSKEEKRMAAARILSNKAGRDVTGKEWNWAQVTEAFMDPVLWFSTFNAFLSSVPNGGITTFGSLLYKSFGFTQLQVLLVGIPRSVMSLILFVIVGFYTRQVANRRMWIMAAATIPPFVGLLALSLLPQDPSLKWTKWGLFLMTVPTVLSLFLAWTLIPSNVAGRTKKTIISSATFLGYCVGNMVGSQIFKTKDAPQYVPGTIGASVCLGLEFVCIVAWRGWYMWQNSKRDRVAAESGITKEKQERLGRELGEQDVTDLRNPYFRYTM
ncbi:uncharacterized protein L3040_006759 [Drepanopeziza brunnea f. sp. 'multigermtubi']|uniref:Major facilitator superfamily transporter n=1 Tax=Marssonina brunnea f. sp. multigermtubi (strain MB_m1) TaxID=1072389 RepID=K1WZE2_MARBU|nr:major facilitator superfamily transporter [Drepanopeziza brunnea f. sp. 'multigermtubi' MB_m1]EKD18366.1 major facilitator superfamily transporter [Drepanopeziza brunnea f. sp. 'multigermtubi' MB_m1]KAJ5039089.1 hypothetical protein L3040_006759 [Drepanopeziza brunnea f. sp. 'multigermtubi']